MPITPKNRDSIKFLKSLPMKLYKAICTIPIIIVIKEIFIAILLDQSSPLLNPYIIGNKDIDTIRVKHAKIIVEDEKIVVKDEIRLKKLLD
jgi:hypothetical protein